MPGVIESVAFAALQAVGASSMFANTLIFLINYSTAVATALYAAGSVAYSQAQARKAARQSASIQGRTVTTREPMAARELIYGQARVGGTIVFAAASGTNNEYLNLVITLAGHECQEIGDILFNDETIPLDGSGNATGSHAGYATVKKHLGAAAQTVDTDLQTEVTAGVWTNNHRLRGIAYIYVRLKHNPDLYASGIPNITAVVKGRIVYDPRSSTTAWSANSALCVRDFLTDSVYGLGMATAEINDTELNAAANICDEAVAILPSGTESRYETNGVASSSATAAEILDELVGAMSGAVFYVGGVWVVRAGAAQTPTITFTEDDLSGPVSIQTKDSRRDTCNAVRGTYVSANSQWQPTDFPPIVNATYYAEDGSERLWRDLVLPFTTSDSAAQRIAKIELERSRQDITVSCRMKLTALKCQCGDTIQLTLARYGWTAKQFDVVSAGLAVDSEGMIAIDLALRETAAAVWDWSAEETTVDLAPNTNLPDPYTVETPSGLALTSGASTALQQPDGTVSPRLKVAWTLSTRSFITNGGFVVIEYKKNADSVWIDWAKVRGDQTADYILDVHVGISYDVRIRFENCWGVRGAYATSTGHTVASNAVTPSAPGAATKTAEGTYTAGDGTVLAYLTFTLPAMPAGAAKQWLLFKLSTATEYTVGAGPFTNTGNLTGVTLMDLTPGAIYTVALIAISSLDIPSAVTGATSSPFTAPSKGASAAIAAITYTAGNASGFNRPTVYVSGVQAFQCLGQWTIPEADIDHYDWTLAVTGETQVNVTATWVATRVVKNPEVAVASLTAAAVALYVRTVNTSGGKSIWYDGGSILAAGKWGLAGGDAGGLNIGTTSGTVAAGDDARLIATGTTAGTQAAGDDSRITGAAQKSSNLSDLGSAATARSNLGVADIATRKSYLASITKTLTGGSATESFTVDITAGGFSAKPAVGLIECVDPLYLVGYDFDNGSNSSTVAYCTIRATDGSNIPAATARFMVLFTD